jgi:hypothetical protein
MATPNIVSPQSVTPKSPVVYAVTTTLAQALTNAAGSNKAIHVDSILCSNIDGTNAADITVSVYDGTTHGYICKTVAVPADATQLVIIKDSSFWLEEGWSIYAQASADGDLQLLINTTEFT